MKPDPYPSYPGYPRRVRRVVIKGDKFKVARIMADAGIPFIFQMEAGPNTVGDVPVSHLNKLTALLNAYPNLEGRYAGQQEQLKAQRNPASRSGVRIVYNKLLGGWYIVRGPHQTPLGGRFNSKEEAQAHLMRHRKNPAPRATAVTSTGDAVAAHELFLFIVNDQQLYNSQGQAIIVNLQRKIKRGIYRPDLALKLWRYLADSGAKKYTYHHDAGKRFGGSWHLVKGYGIFTVPIREAAARELAAHYDAAIHSKIDPRGAHINPIKGPGKYEGELYVTRYAHENENESLGDVQDFGWFGRFSGKIKGRGPFHIITQEDSQGFVYGQLFNTEKKMLARWNDIEREYEKFSEGQNDE